MVKMIKLLITEWDRKQAEFEMIRIRKPKKVKVTLQNGTELFFSYHSWDSIKKNVNKQDTMEFIY